ncbi:MAG: hypothetical protein JOZ41_14265 [Chloroflexi bacterium]|nr:hypothetical protein [Chloroflexota bacterium]
MTASTVLYRLLLLAYPRAFLKAYGEEMARVFQDSCRDAYSENGPAGLLPVWGRALLDLTDNVMQERALEQSDAVSLLLGQSRRLSDTLAGDVVTCPFCSEEADSAWTRCRYCGSDMLVVTARARARTVPARNAPAPGYAAAQLLANPKRFYEWSYGEPRRPG